MVHFKDFIMDIHLLSSRLARQNAGSLQGSGLLSHCLLSSYTTISRDSLGLSTEIPDRQPNQSDMAVKFHFLTHSEGESMKNAFDENLVIVVIEIVEGL